MSIASRDPHWQLKRLLVALSEAVDGLESELDDSDPSVLAGDDFENVRSIIVSIEEIR